MKWSSSEWLASAALATGLALVCWQRPLLAENYHRNAAAREAYLLPPPAQTVVLSLGYRSALADLIFAHVLVSTGTHLIERRLFESGGPYLETVNELDPKFRDPYRLADAIITLQSVPVPEELQRQARAILLRGTRELPYDQQLWAAAGQFLAYLAPSRLSNPAEADAFRLEGARLLAHACELIGSNDNIPYHCITASALFSAAGNRVASRALLEKMLVVTDDPELRAMAERQLGLLDGEDSKRALNQRAQRMDDAKRRDLPFVSNTEYAVLGPGNDAAACAGKRPQAPGDPCSTSQRALLGNTFDDEQ